MKRFAFVTGYCLVIFGCGGRTHASATVGVAGDAGSEGVPSDTGTGNQDVSLADSQGQPLTSDTEAPPPPDLTLRPTVWIGETDRTVTFPAAGLDGGDTILAVPDRAAASPPEKVTLILNQVTDSVTGTITFGDVGRPPLPVDAQQRYPPVPTKAIALDGAVVGVLVISSWVEVLYPGFSYSLVSSRLTGDLLNLSFVPAELYRDWCRLQDPDASTPPYVDSISGTTMCDCSSSPCRSLSSPIQRLDLTVSGNSMQGQLPEGSNGFDLRPAAAIRLTRVQ